MSDFYTTLGGDCFGLAVTQALSASTTKIAGIYQSPAADVITHVGVCVTAITNPPVLEVQVQSLDSSSNPSGSLFSVGASATFTPAAGFTWIALGTPVTVAKGDGFAAVIQYSSGTVDGTHIATFNRSINGNIQFSLPCAATNTGSWSKSTGRPCIAIKLQTTGIIQGGIPASSITHTAYSTGSSPNERGIVFVPDVNCRAVGINYTPYYTNTGSTGTVYLYDSNNNILASVDVSGGRSANITSYLQVREFFDAFPTLTAGSTYRLAQKATHASNTIALAAFVFPSTAERISVFGTSYATSRTGTGSWTDSTTTGYGMSLVLDSLTGNGFIQGRGIGGL